MLSSFLATIMMSSHPVQDAPIHIETKSFEYVTSPATGAVSWTNRQTGAQIKLGGHPEVELEIGETPDAATKVKLQPAKSPQLDPSDNSAEIHLTGADGSLSIRVILSADPTWPAVLHKQVEVTNIGTSSKRILNVVLARFPVGGAKAEGGERGFPLYLDDQFFVGLAHPAGYAQVENNEVVLLQYPGARVAPGETFRSMEAVYGVAKRQGAKQLFIDYLLSRMARVVFGHDHAYAVLEAFGGQPDGEFKRNFSVGVSAAYLLKHLGEVAKSKRENHVQFDFYGLEFWHDRAGDLKTFNRENFPNGFGEVRDRILDLDMKPALWIDSGRLPDWTIDQNPAVKGCFTVKEGVGGFCRASEPLAQIYKDAYLYQIRENKVGLVKFDNLESVCNNPAHDHLPGPRYSTEAIYNSIIDFFKTLRAASPALFIELYWGYHSPWWLLYGDTCFDTGGNIEAASPAQFPTPYARDSVTQRLDQAQRTVSDTPWLGKDSLGVWLSDWAWNSGIGKAHWQEGVIMDMARGNLLLQLWTDADWLTPPEREQVATFISLLKVNDTCFRDPHQILGNPDNAEPYGYRCSDGKRTFLAIDNACLKDSVVNIDFQRECGFQKDGRFDVYRWYPQPARIASSMRDGLKLGMRPYEVALVEVVPVGYPPSLGRKFVHAAPAISFEEPTQLLRANLDIVRPPNEPIKWAVLKPATAVAKAASLTIMPDRTILAGGTSASEDVYTVTAGVGAGRFSGILLEALTDPSLPANGPGRGENGNFALTDVKVRVIRRDAPDREVKLTKAESDFDQTSYGGWPAAATIDNDMHSGWSIHPLVGQDHAIVWTLAEPLDLPRGAQVAITLAHGENRHNLGRFRLSVTDSAHPSYPSAYRRGPATISISVPSTKTGGLLLVVGSGAEGDPNGEFGEIPVTFNSVWSRDSNWACPWNAWRAELAPSSDARAVRIHLPSMSAQAAQGYKVYFLPSEGSPHTLGSP